MVIKILKSLQYLKRQEIELVFEAEYLFLLGSHPNGERPSSGKEMFATVWLWLQGG